MSAPALERPPGRRRDLAARTNEPDAFARPDGTEKLQLKVGGMSCSFCVASITRALERTEGVQAASVNLAHEETLIRYDPNRVTPSQLKETLLDLGYTVREASKERTFEEEEADLRRERHNLLLAGGFAAIAVGLMALMWAGLLAPTTQASVFLLWVMPTLALATVVGPGWRILTMAWASLRRGILNQHVLLELGAFAGLLGGFLGYAFPIFPIPDFFAVAVFITTYHLLSGYVSLEVRTRSSRAVSKLLALVPPTARVVRDGREEEVPIEQVFADDLVRVRPGESIPVDGEVVEGTSEVDQSLVTGESMPQEKEPGDSVIGGSVNQAGTLLVRVTRVGAASFLQQVARQVEEARALKPGLLALIDRVLAVYVPAVLAFAGLAVLVWTVGAWVVTGQPDWARAVFAALAVLVMGYPCALGMATPLAMIRGGGMAAQQGVLMRSAEAFQVLEEVKKVVLDKTGTITRGKPAVVEVVALGGHDKRETLRLAAAAESPSEHPLARAVVAAAQAQDLALASVTEFRAVAGKGVTATIEGHRLAIGSPRFIEQQLGAALGPAREPLEALQAAGKTVVILAVDGQPAALIALADQVKADAREAIDQLRSDGLEPVMLTGDNARTARAVAEQVGISEYRAEVLPQDKAAVVRDLQRGGARVAMVGDGINDAPALMQADVGIAIGAGTDIAIESADVVLIGERLGAVVDAYRIGKASYARTVQNIALALVFNGIGVPLAVAGVVHPVWAMIAMAASVSTVLANSFGVKVAQVRPPRNLAVTSVLALLMAGFVLVYNALVPVQAGMSGLPVAGSTMPSVKGYAEGQAVQFFHTEASDPQIAQTLSNMVRSPVLVVPELAHVPDTQLANVYVFTNGIKDGGPLGFQPDVFDSPPGTSGYRPLRALNVVTWSDERFARELKSAAEVQAAQQRGDVTIERPGVVINMPLVVWPGGHR